MAEHHAPQGPFDIPEIPNFVPRKLKPWIFILFVLIIQFSGSIYLASVADMVGSTALMQEDILMAGYASFIGLSLCFTVMFRFKFRFSTRTQLLTACIVLIAANFICAHTDSVPVLVITCFIAGWCRMQATFACNSTIQLWLTPVRDMAVFFCFVNIIVDGMIQLNGIAAIYSAFFMQWEYMHWIIIGLLAFMMIVVAVLIKPLRCPMYIPLLGIDWIGAILWGVFMLCYTFVCVYGNYFDWWDAEEIRVATILGLACMGINLWRATFLHHPYISFQTFKNHNVKRAVAIYLVFFTILATEHVCEHTYASGILGFDETNLIDLNWYAFAGIVAGSLFTYITFALLKWRYKTMTAIGFALAVAYLSCFYFFLDYGVEKEMLFIPLFCRGMSTVIISIIFLTSMVQSGLPFQVFPQALSINGFACALVSATFGPALVGEMLRRIMAKNAALLSSAVTDFNTDTMHIPIAQIYGMVQQQALAISLKEVYGWMLILALTALSVILVSYSNLRPLAIFPKWKTIRRSIRHVVKIHERVQRRVKRNVV